MKIVGEKKSAVTAPNAGGWKGLAAAMLIRIRKLLTPDLGKRAAICLFMLLLLLCEYISGFVARPNIGSIVNPFIQGMWLYLAIFGLSLLPGGLATKILLTFWTAVMGTVAVTGVFLHLRFALEVDHNTFFVLAASSTAEIVEFIRQFLTWRVGIAMLMAIAVFGGMIVLIWRTKFIRSYVNAAVALLLALPFAVNCIRYTAGGETERIYSRSNLPRIVAGYFIYRSEFSRLLTLEKKPELPAGIRELPGGGEVVGVLVIGESANSSHMAVYGYPRDTTPELAKRRESCLIYDDVVAPASITTEALYYMFTDARLTAGRNPAAFTLIDVFKAAGWRVVLISNQKRWGEFDSSIGILTAHCDRRTYLHEKIGNPYDMDILPELEKELRRNAGGRLLVIVHLIGSHKGFVWRYPREFARFDDLRDRCNSGMREEHARELNEYDNSIAYTDRVLGAVLSRLEKMERPVFMLYCSDHSDIGDWSGCPSRAAGSVIPDIYEIPYVLWGNPAYRKAFPKFWERAARNLHVPMQTDSLIWSVISAAQLTFDGFPEDEDIFARKVVSEQPSATYGHGDGRMMADVPYYPSAAKRKLRGAAQK